MVSLAVVGVVSILTVPVVMNNVQEARKKTVFKETVALITQAVYQGASQGELEVGVDTEAWLMNRLNGVKTCPLGGTNACTKQIRTGTPHPTKGIVLPNGAAIDFYEVAPNYSLAYIDWNGDAPPNNASATGDTLFLCYNPTGSAIANHWCTENNKALLPGQTTPHFWYPHNVTLYNSVMGS